MNERTKPWISLAALPVDGRPREDLGYSLAFMPRAALACPHRPTLLEAFRGWWR